MKEKIYKKETKSEYLNRVGKTAYKWETDELKMLKIAAVIDAGYYKTVRELLDTAVDQLINNN